MSKIVKATTARKRALAVDLFQIELARVASIINDAASRGLMSVNLFLDEEYEDQVAEVLIDAGYSLSYQNLQFSSHTPPRRSVFQKLFGLHPNPDLGDVSVLGPQIVRIGWAEIVETEDGDFAEAV